MDDKQDEKIDSAFFKYREILRKVVDGMCEDAPEEFADNAIALAAACGNTVAACFTVFANKEEHAAFLEKFITALRLDAEKKRLAAATINRAAKEDVSNPDK